MRELAVSFTIKAFAKGQLQGKQKSASWNAMKTSHRCDAERKLEI